ncbi:MAG TPA: cytochrome c oxidase subunit 3 [Novosphingobium sp.]|nr:cytochrome c oxidase subunit 3 [Novosphingobium sp.]
MAADASTVPDEVEAIPGDSGVWFFICADMATFALFFLFFSLERMGNVGVFEASRQQLHLGLGLANTLILLTSGAFMAHATRKARGGDWEGARTALLLTLASGSLFAVTKLVEWGMKVEQGISLSTNGFFIYYFALTGIHFLHFIIGVGVLAVLIARCRRDLPQAERLRWIEAGGAYWHMVDLLWIVLFAMLYLQAAA